MRSDVFVKYAVVIQGAETAQVSESETIQSSFHPRALTTWLQPRASVDALSGA